jgi:Transcriptional regulator, AbiEi antitoxin, Type IV TA system/Crp-like helix-turn-helix domain
MKFISEKEALEKIVDHFAKWLKVSKRKMRIRDQYQSKKVDGFLKVGKHEFFIEIKSGSNSAQVTSAIQSLKNSRIQPQRSLIPLIVVPFMGDVGRKLCEDSNVSWADLSGNADISAPNLRILIEGHPNLYKNLGRPSSPFAPKSARIARWLLINAEKSMTQRELSLATNVDEGHTSRIISRLEGEELISRKNDGSIFIPNPDLLLDSWREKYDFKKNRIIKGHIAARSSNEILKKISDLLSDKGVLHAATGLCGAWLYTKFAGFRIVTFYINEQLPEEFKKTFGFREEKQGSNVWFVVPKDEGVFHGSKKVEDTICAHPIQVYLDLFGHPERAKEAADNLRKTFLNWNKHA